jgi:shikimate kinase
MKLNGVLTSAALSSSYMPVMAAMEQGALSASMSGNGPSIAAVTYEGAVERIVNALSKFEGKIIVSKVNNERANVRVIDG